MAETDVLTYKQAPPRRPNIDDLHGGLLQNHSTRPPGREHPNANGMNQGDKLHAAAHALLDFAKIWVQFDGGGVPFIAGVACLNDEITADDFTVVDGGTGITEITHTGGLFPAVQWPAAVDVNGNAGDTTGNAEHITNGWSVRTRTGGTLANIAFTLRVSGL